MRKFIVKNRQKRRYTKRNSNTSSFSLPDLALIGLIPSILIATAYLTTNIHRLNDITLSYPVIDLTFNPGGAVAALSAVLHEISSHLVRFFFRIFSVIATTWSIFTNFLTHLSSQGINLAQHAAEAGQSAVGSVGEWLITHAISLAEMLRIAVLDVVAWIADAVYQITRSIIFLFAKLLANLRSSTAGFFMLIAAPFHSIGEYLIKLHPVYEYFRIAFTDAALELDAGLRNVLNIATNLPKVSATKQY
jgi:hypothetical protein